MVVAVPKKASPLMQRVKPAGAVVVGGLIFGLNVVALMKGAFYFPFGNVLGCALTLAGLFGVVVGEPDDPYGNRPLWFKVGIAVCAVLGIVIGLVLNIELAA